MRGRVAAAVVLLLIVVTLASIWNLPASEPRRAERVELTIRLWNIDDTAVLYVGCEQRAVVEFPDAGLVRVNVHPSAVITVQVDNDRNGYSWGVRVKAGNRSLLTSKEGVAGLFGANGNDLTREFETVFDESVRADGDPARSPACVRV